MKNPALTKDERAAMDTLALRFQRAGSASAKKAVLQEGVALRQRAESRAAYLVRTPVSVLLAPLTPAAIKKPAVRPAAAVRQPEPRRHVGIYGRSQR